VIWDEEEPINFTMIWDEEEANFYDHMGDTSLFDVHFFDRPFGNKIFLDEAVLDHNVIPYFVDCMVSFSDPIGFDEGSVLTMHNNKKIIGRENHAIMMNMKKCLY
jgi:hypothetical protein